MAGSHRASGRAILNLLRNACNAFPTPQNALCVSSEKRYKQIVTPNRLMITLRLTLSELEQLRFALGAQPLADAARNALLSKLDAAQQQACLQRICPICRNTFTQLKAGRTADYCSAACKQKAYRQRRYRALSH